MFNIANFLSFLRILLAPIFVYVFFLDGWGWAFVAFWIALGIELTDIYDGRLARQYGVVSDFGKLFDPIADRISRFTIFLAFLAAGLAPLWMVTLLYLRDEMVSLIRMLAANRNIVVAARQSGKIKAVTQGIAICVTLFVKFVLLFLGVSDQVYTDVLYQTAWFLMFLTTATTLVSLVDYLYSGREVLKSYR